MRAFLAFRLSSQAATSAAIRLSTVQSPVQALAVHDVDLRLRHVQPTAVLGRVVELDLVQEPTRLLRPETPRTGSPRRGCSGCPAPTGSSSPGGNAGPPSRGCSGRSPAGASVGHRDVTPAPQRFAHHQLVADPFAFVLVVHDGRESHDGLVRGGRTSPNSCLLASSKQTTGYFGSYGSM